jgi:hypothetical protein
VLILTVVNTKVNITTHDNSANFNIFALFMFLKILTSEGIPFDSLFFILFFILQKQKNPSLKVRDFCYTNALRRIVLCIPAIGRWDYT